MSLLQTEIFTTFVVSLNAGRTLRLTNVTKEEAEVIQEAISKYYDDFDRLCKEQEDAR